MRVPPQLASFYQLTFMVTISSRLILVVVAAAATTPATAPTQPTVSTPYGGLTNASQYQQTAKQTLKSTLPENPSASSTQPPRSLAPSSPQQVPFGGEPTIGEQFQLGGKCATKSSCKQRDSRLELDESSDKRSCYCDEKCSHYDDCCQDSAWSRPFKQRIDLGLEGVRRARQQWHCHRVNPIFGDILLRASCSGQWLAEQRDKGLAEQVKRRCEYVKDRGKRQLPPEYQTDPVGMMMPITDLASGITYANSYCLRCNRLPFKPPLLPQAPAKLIYWSPLLTCNYNLETDERNTLYDLISANKGQALKYSSKRNKWIINATTSSRGSSRPDNKPQISPIAVDDMKNDRVCTIAPTIPDSVEHIIRYCRSDTIDSCPRQTNEPMDLNRTRQYEAWRLECEFGHQALAYSQTSDAIYFNLACAKCNHEKQVFCEPKLKKDPGLGVVRVVIPSHDGSPKESTRILSSPGDPDSEEEGGEDTESGPDSSGISSIRGGGEGEAKSSTAFSGSFSILIDLYGSSQGDEQVGAIHQCPDMENQVYDPFHNVCRDIVCGLKQQQNEEGKCVDIKEGSAQLRVDLVDKFRPTMAYITATCLTISIASLSMYLALYCLSMFDLRHLVVDMAQAAADQTTNREGVFRNPPLDKHRSSKCSSTASSGGGSKRSQSLSSRGVACLASSLLIAYLFFIFGHQPSFSTAPDQSQPQQQALPETISSNHSNQEKHPNHHQQQQQQQVTVTCLVLALGTYYCFLVAFNWMFLLAYDIWRTLRLATCQLRGPSMHSQSKRFLSYMLFSLTVSGLIVGAAFLVDQLPYECHESQSVIAPQINGLYPKNCTNFEWEISEFMQIYRPKFGHRAGSCWFSNRRSLALFFGLPIALIMFLNLMFFLHSSFMVIRTSSRSSRHLSQQSGGSKSTVNMGVQAAAKSNGENCPRLVAVISNVDSSIGGLPSESSDTSDYIHQNSLTTNSMISVQTIQSHLSTGGSSDESINLGESPGPARRTEGARDPQQPQLTQVPSVNTTTTTLLNSTASSSDSPEAGPCCDNLERKRRQLVASQSSGSLTNQSIGASSVTVSLALKYDTHLQNLAFVMGSVVKDYRLYCRLSTIMGLTWLTGLVASVVDQSDALWYVFVVLNTLQGLFIFIAFGCKRSKLNNLEILLSYLRFRWFRFSERWRRKPPTEGIGEKMEQNEEKIQGNQ